MALAAPVGTRFLDQEATCSMKVQQPCHTWPTAANLYRLRPDRKDIQRPCRRKLRIGRLSCRILLESINALALGGVVAGAAPGGTRQWT